MSTRANIKIEEHKSARIRIACTAAILALGCVGVSLGDHVASPLLRIHLPREVTVKDADLSLGQISVIQGTESLVASANGIAMGRISLMSQRVVIDRPTILSRLASSGISSSKVVFTGANETTVRRQQQTVGSRELVALASAFLKSNPPDASARQWSVLRAPKDLIVPAAGDELRLAPQWVPSSTKNQARVEIAVWCGDKKIEARDVIFAMKYNCRQAVTTTDIAKGAILGPENVKIDVIPSNYPEPADWKPPFGLVANRPLAANTVLRPYMTGSGKSPVVVKRNQSVVIRIEKPGFLITAVGMTMEDGGIGEHIRVRNVDSQRIILARINEDGSVEPVL
ncbi:MAG: flagella basal body P-ring formation protein FlgA [Planctomycetes bacterium RBG_16_55_9]|nr:MAG: flagella basal body P-ring formation protein FlgA [Planctomycetes bacterium RBG_16_55_9]